MPAIIRCRIFCLSSCYPKVWRSRWTVILPDILYGCEAWSLTVREERRLSVFESGVLRRYMGLRRTR